MICKDHIQELLLKVQEGAISVKDASECVKDLFYEDIGFAKIDNLRPVIKGFPEVVFCQGKTKVQIGKIVDKMITSPNPLLLTRANQDIFHNLVSKYPDLKFSQEARIIYKYDKKNIKSTRSIGVVTAGTSDIPVAEEATVTAEVMGSEVTRLYDVGVAGIHRLIGERKRLNKSQVLIVVAGMEGALPSIVGGMVSCPVIAVPTSIGYGANFKGLSALLGMLNSCSPGVTVVNIDNGFGAGYFASLIVNLDNK